MESPLIDVRYDAKSQSLGLVIAYAAEALSDWAGAAMRGCTPAEYQGPPTDFRYLAFEGVSDVVCCDEPWDGIDDTWRRDSRPGDRVPARICGWHFATTQDSFEIQIYVEPAHDTEFRWRFMRIFEARRRAISVDTTIGDARVFRDVDTGEEFVRANAF